MKYLVTQYRRGMTKDKKFLNLWHKHRSLSSISEKILEKYKTGMWVKYYIPRV